MLDAEYSGFGTEGLPGPTSSDSKTKLDSFGINKFKYACDRIFRSARQGEGASELRRKNSKNALLSALAFRAGIR
jgi:hypothetical protein